MKYLITAIIVIGVITICLVVLSVSKSRPTYVIGEITVMPDVTKTTVPVSLSIERIGVYAPIESVGIVGDAMAVPTLANNVGWYRASARPGDMGSAVLAGHVNWMGGKDAVFTNLSEIEIGDIVSVTNNYGDVENFLVREKREYPADADTSEVFLSYDGLAHLNLITCTGIWNPLMGTHDTRLVVFTDKI